MIRRPPISTRTYTPFPYPSLDRSSHRIGRPSRLIDRPCNAVFEPRGSDGVSGQMIGAGAAIGLQVERQQTVGNVAGRSVVNLSFRSEEHTSELQSLMSISYDVF